MGNNNYLWGIDLGGTKIECAVLAKETPVQVITRQRIQTETEKGYQHIMEQIKNLINIVAAEVGEFPSAVGIGTPGSLEPSTKTMKNCNTTCLNGKPLKIDLENLLGIRVKIANDANCFVLAETLLGIIPEVKPDAEVVFGIIMGTGVGGGIMANGKLINGMQGIAGEWGHNFLDVSGGKCYCGKTGCVETVISGPALEKFYYSLSNIRLSLQEIIERYNAGTDASATTTIERLITMFGKATAYIVNILDPDVIILGGGLGNIDLLYNRGMDEIKKHIFNSRPEVYLVKPVLGDSAGVFGAAMLL